MILHCLGIKCQNLSGFLFGPSVAKFCLKYFLSFHFLDIMQQLADQYRQFKLRPWDDFLNFQRFKVPEDPNKALTRVITNLNYYAVNYVIVGSVFLLISMYDTIGTKQQHSK